MLSKYCPNHSTRLISIAAILISLLSACLGQVPTDEPVTIYTDTPISTDPPTSTPSPRVQELQVANWRISSFTCDKNGTVENVTVEVTAEGGTLPYTYTTERFADSNPPATKQVPPTDAQPTAAPAQNPAMKTKNSTATAVPTDTQTPVLATLPPLLPGQLRVNVQLGVEKINIQSADGQSVTLEIMIPSSCSDVDITQIAPMGTPGSSLSPTSSPQPTPTATAQSLNLPRRPVCSDGLDNDGDGYVDLYDHNCKSKGDQDESH